MDISLELVREQCGRYLHNFASCVERFPETWHLDCQNQKLKLAQCAENNPAIVEVKQQCAQVFEDYEKCVNKNPVKIEACASHYHAFNKCAQDVLHRFAGLDSKDESSS